MWSWGFSSFRANPLLSISYNSGSKEEEEFVLSTVAFLSQFPLLFQSWVHLASAGSQSIYLLLVFAGSLTGGGGSAGRRAELILSRSFAPALSLPLWCYCRIVLPFNVMKRCRRRRLLMHAQLWTCVLSPAELYILPVSHKRRIAPD